MCILYIPLVRAVPWAIQVLWFAGAAIFGALAYATFRAAQRVGPGGAIGETGDDAPTQDHASRGKWHAVGVWRDGLAAGAGNPINIAWWAGLLGPALENPSMIRITFPAGVLLGPFSWFTLVAFGISRARARFSNRVYRWILFTSALILSLFAVAFLVVGVMRVRW